jgi:hypothetical protein
MIGTALAIGSMLLGGLNQIRAGKAAKEAQDKLNQRKKELDLEYKLDYNLDFLNTPMAKSTISLLSQEYIKNARKVAQGNVISGASDEKAVAMGEKLQEPMVNAISSLAGYGQQRQDMLLAENRRSQNALFGMDYGQSMQKSGNLMNAASNAFGAAGSLAMADAFGGFNKADDWLKNLFKTTPATFAPGPPTVTTNAKGI